MNFFQPPPMAQGRPWDGVAGVDASIQEAQLRRAQESQLHQMYLQQQQQAAETERFRGETPYHLQQQQFKGAEAQAKLPYVGQNAQGYGGIGLQQHAAGQKATRTLEGEVGATNSKNLINELESTARALELASTAGGLGAQEGYSEWRKKISPTMQQYFGEAYTPDTPQRIRAISEWLKNTPEFRQKQQLQEQSESAGLVREAMGNEARNSQVQAQIQSQENVARIQADARDRPQTPENQDRAVARLIRELRADPNNQGTRQELAYYLSKLFVDDFAKDARGMMLALEASSNPEKAKEYELYQGWSRAKYFDQHGMDNQVGQLTFEEFKWVNAAMNDPRGQGMTPDQAIEMGRRLGRIKTKKRQ